MHVYHYLLNFVEWMLKKFILLSKFNCNITNYGEVVVDLHLQIGQPWGLNATPTSHGYVHRIGGQVIPAEVVVVGGVVVVAGRGVVGGGVVFVVEGCVGAGVSFPLWFPLVGTGVAKCQT